MAESSNGPVLRGVREERWGACHVFIIDRGGALNAIDASMVSVLAERYPKVARDASIYAVVLRSADPRAFSAGGDVRALVEAAARDIETAKAWLGAEYRLNWLHECFSKPSIALIDGIVMGSGVGISAYATHRVAGARYKFAMPETAIGFFPDVGSAYFLSRMPNRIGLYLGLTGSTIGRADAYALGLVTHCIDADAYPAIEAALADCQPVDPVLDGLHVDPGAGLLEEHAELISECFAGPTIASIVSALEDAGQGGASVRGDASRAAFAQATLATLQSRSPLALAVTLRHLRDAAVLDLRQTLEADYRLACRFLETSDFAEGVRAVLVDKDQKPRWRPARIADVTDDMLDDMFAPMPGLELNLPLRQQMQALRV